MSGEQALRSFPESPGEEVQALGYVPGPPIRVLIAEPDATSRRLICSLVDCEPEMTAECVDDSQLVSSIQETVPELVILDANTPVIRRGGTWDAVGARTELQTADRTTRAESGMPRQFVQRLAVEADEKIVLIRVEEIQWMQSLGKYIRLYVGEKSHLLRQSLKNLQAVLDPRRFLRVHRNAIVNLDHVDEFYLPPSGNMFVKLNNGVSLPLRRANRTMLRKLLKQIS